MFNFFFFWGVNLRSNNPISSLTGIIFIIILEEKEKKFPTRSTLKFSYFGNFLSAKVLSNKIEFFI